MLINVFALTRREREIARCATNSLGGLHGARREVMRFAGAVAGAAAIVVLWCRDNPAYSAELERCWCGWRLDDGREYPTLTRALAAHFARC